MGSMEEILNQAGVPFVVAIVCVVYGIRMILTGDVSLLRSKNAGPLKDEKEYAKQGGILMIFLGLASVLMGILIFINLYVAIGEMIAAMLILGIAWKNMNSKYGA